MTDRRQSEAISYVARQVGSGPLRYRARASFLFDGIPLQGRRVLDVGCGPGTFSLWAALHGADYVLGIEPETEGSTSGSLGRFRSILSSIEVDGEVDVRNALLQDLEVPERPFDVVVMYNVINHIDEWAVERLDREPAAADRYLHVLRDLPRLVSPGGYLIVADCGRENFWGSRGWTSPLARTIEWPKHQEPETWSVLLAKLGFRLHDVRWSPWFPLGRLSANRLVQYMTGSHFVLRMRNG